MKLILKEYLAALKEREQLDVMLPELLSAMGMNVFSIPQPGVTQRGVDVGAIFDDSVYLFSVKAGDLSRSEWSREKTGLRAELEEILDAYITSRIPTKHRDKPIVICVCIGGKIAQDVHELVYGFFEKNKSESIGFEEWNGDMLADLLIGNLLNERLLLRENQSLLRKSLALIDEPEASYNHFSALIHNLAPGDDAKPKEILLSLRQLSICLWTLYGWSRQADNYEAIFRVSELSLLHAWEMNKFTHGNKQKVSKQAILTLQSIQEGYFAAVFDYTEKVRIVTKREQAISVNVGSQSDLDVNLKLFDVLGRLALAGLWFFRVAVQPLQEDEEENHEALQTNEQLLESYSQGIIDLVSNNTILFSPYKDDQAIDIALAIMLLSLRRTPTKTCFIENWIREMTHRSRFSFETHGKYVTTINDYNLLLEHPSSTDDAHRVKHTKASVLFPMLGMFAALFAFDEAYQELQGFQRDLLSHCEFQYWYLNEDSEPHLYLNSAIHGNLLCDVTLQKDSEEFLSYVFDECDHSTSPEDLSIARVGFWPIVLVACRHYRLPVPLNFFSTISRD